MNGELSASDLREDQFTAKDYYRAGLSPPPELRADPAMGLVNYRSAVKQMLDHNINVDVGVLVHS